MFINRAPEDTNLYWKVPINFEEMKSGSTMHMHNMKEVEK